MLKNNLPVALWRMFGGGMLGALTLVVFLAVPAMAAGPDYPSFGSDGFPWHDATMLPIQGPRQVFREDLTLESGQVIEDDVFVYSGDVDIKGDGRITGDLVVYSGDVEIGENAVVEGNITNYSGNVKLAGFVGGDIAAMSGNVVLEASARVDGDISVVSGRIERDDASSIGGNVVQGPSFRFPSTIFPDLPRGPAGISFGKESPNFFSLLLNFIGRLFVAAFLTALTMLLVGGLFHLRPKLIVDTREHLKEQLALSAVVGVLANLTVLFLAGLLAVTICLLPLALVPMLLLLAVNVVGWSVASQIVGERIAKVARQEVRPALTILVGAFFLTGSIALLWAIGGYFRPLAFLLVLAVSSLGTGAALVPWINRRRGFGGADGGGGDVPLSRDVRPGGPTSGTSATTAGDMVDHDVAAPIDYVTAEEINAAAEMAVAPESRPRPRRDSKVTESDTTQPVPTEETTVERDVAAPLDYVTAHEVNVTEAQSKADDFTQIKGVGPIYAQRLKDGGFTTFAQLAAASPEDVAAAMGWPPDRVRRAEVIDQAKVLAQ